MYLFSEILLIQLPLNSACSLLHVESLMGQTHLPSMGSVPSSRICGSSSRVRSPPSQACPGSQSRPANFIQIQSFSSSVEAALSLLLGSPSSVCAPQGSSNVGCARCLRVYLDCSYRSNAFLFWKFCKRKTGAPNDLCTAWPIPSCGIQEVVRA